jgi:oxalate decarboxylase
MIPLQRRTLCTAAGLFGAATVAGAASFGNPHQPPQGAINAQANPQSLTDPGPKNLPLAGQFPSFQNPPATDVGGMPLFWASFNNAPKRIQNGGSPGQFKSAPATNDGK